MKRWLWIILPLFLSCHNSMNVSATKDAQEGYLTTYQVKLSLPHITADSLFFRATSNVAMVFGLDGADILYRFNEGDFVPYLNPITVDKSLTLSAKTVKKGFIDSDTVKVQFIKVNNQLAHALVNVEPEPHGKYSGKGAATLVDHQKGSLNFGDGDLWCGFQNKVVTISIDFGTPTAFQAINISTLSDANSWIFSPKKIKIFLDGHILREQDCELTKQDDAAQLKIIPIKFKPVTGSSLQVVIETMEFIPEWHPGAGTPPWLFIDEIIIE